MLSPVSRKLGNNAAPGWQVLLFVGAGSMGFLIILAFGDFVYKYTYGYRAYSDLIFQHADTRMVAAWYLRDATVRFGATLMPSTVGDATWKIVGPR